MLRKFSLPNARLSRRVVLLVFASIVSIEGILLIPSVLRRRKEYLSQIEEVSAGQVKVLVRTAPPNDSDGAFLSRIKQLENEPIKLLGKLQHRILGGVLYQSNTGKVLGKFGEEPQLSYEEVIQNTNPVNPEKPYYVSYGDRFDAAWTPGSMMREYILIFRHDTSTVSEELNAFILRIIGLVIIISLFVTLGVWFALDPLVISPILCLRKDLIRAGNAVKQDLEPPQFASLEIDRKDELGEVIVAFNQMFNKITEAI
ncbi:MAG: HAMP domain-containing protein, partial [Cyanobacteriota bacterium]|nr:HAMP domain-containing protein [Cyanobacteriota bacterium]